MLRNNKADIEDLFVRLVVLAARVATDYPRLPLDVSERLGRSFSGYDGSLSLRSRILTDLVSSAVINALDELAQLRADSIMSRLVGARATAATIAELGKKLTDEILMELVRLLVL